MKRVPALVVALLLARSAFAYTWADLGEGNSISGAGGSITLSYLTATNELTYNYAKTAGTDYGVFMYLIPSSAVHTSGAWNQSGAAVVFDVGGSAAASNSATITVAPGTWFVMAIRSQSGGVHDDVKFYQVQSCPAVAYDKYIDNRLGTAARVVRLVAVDGSNRTVIPGTSKTVAVGAVEHLSGNFTTCGSIVLEEQKQTGDGLVWEVSDGDPPVATEERLPDPPPAPTPVIADPSTATLDPVPNPDPAFPQRTTDGGMTEDRWTRGILDVLRNMAIATQVSVGNGQSTAQATKYQSDRLQSIDNNVAVLRRNSDEERAGRAANNARLDAIKENTKATAEALKDDPVPLAQQMFASAPDAQHKTDLSDGLVKALRSRLPSAPTVTLPTSETLMSVTFRPPGMSQDARIELDLEQYSAGITVFKTVVRAALTVAFFLITVKTIRNTFAG